MVVLDLSEIESPDSRSFGGLGCRRGADFRVEVTIGGDAFPHEMIDPFSVIGDLTIMVSVLVLGGRQTEHT